MPRRTKIVATIGPASDSPAVLSAMIDAGMDVARMGLAHGGLEDQLRRYARIRKAAVDVGRPIGILVDLPGPKVRAASFPEDGIMLRQDAEVRLVPGENGSTAEVIEVQYDSLLSDVRLGDKLAFGDGAVVLDVFDKDGDALLARVRHGGKVQGRPGVHIPADRLRMRSPTDEDLRLLDAFVEVDVDFVAISFVRSAHDIRRVGTEPHPRGPMIVAKIETQAALDNLDGIIEASGAVMVARGDLGTEASIEDLPHLQKHIIRSCIAGGRPVITATQMLESMITNPTPTRAEASDVANAVFDGSSAVMLSGESAIGHDPVNAVRTMARIAERADHEFDYEGWAEGLARLRMAERGTLDLAVTDTMTAAANRVAADTNAAAIICLSRTGFTVRAMARWRPRARVIGMSPDERAVRQLTLSWGSTPLSNELLPTNDAMVTSAIEHARDAGHIHSGELVVVLAGTTAGSKATDVLRLVRVP